MPNLDDYASIVGRDVIGELHFLAEKLKGKTITIVNSTSVGGGVAEILTRVIPILRELGVDARWDVIKGDSRFFRITKNIHNALHGLNIGTQRTNGIIFWRLTGRMPVISILHQTINSIVERFNVDRDRPIVTQISRFDKLKDQAGVIEVYKKVKKHIDCQLVLAGGGAADDPDSLQVYKMIESLAEKDPDIHVIYLPPSSDIEINALQRASTVILQKSLREGFGLTVTEALWKAKPVIATAVGGIPLQITHKYSGIILIPSQAQITT